jgi:dephospho-CoA kinase
MKPLLVGITGGIGAGKSVVCKIFQALSVPIYDADSRAKWLMNHNDSLKAKIINLFGFESYENDQLNREWMGKKVFQNTKLLKQLNSLVHPAVSEDFAEFVGNNSDAKYIVKEAALLIETESYKSLDYLILVTAPLALRIERVKVRDAHRTVEDIESIISKQLSDDEKIHLADTIISNDGVSLLIPQVLKLHEQFSE